MSELQPQTKTNKNKQTKTLKNNRDIIWASQSFSAITNINQHYWLNISKITENDVIGKIPKESVPMFQRCFVNSV